MTARDRPPAARTRRLCSRWSALRGGRSAAAVAFTFALHVATGFGAVAVHYGSMYLFLRAGASPVAASALGFGPGALARFALTYYAVFLPSRGLAVSGRRFAVAILLQLLLNSALLWILLAIGVPVWPAQMAATISLTIATYVVYRLWVFV
jgi:putative flippase GtrA